MCSVILVTVILTMHLRIFKTINLYSNPFAFQFVESSGKIKCVVHLSAWENTLKGSKTKLTLKTKDTQSNAFKEFLK